MVRRTILGLLAVAAVAAVVAFVAPAVVPATPTADDVAFDETANAAAVRGAAVRRPALPPLPVPAPAAPVVLGCAVVLLGAFLVTLLGRRPDDDGVDWRSLLEGAPPVRA